MGNGIVQAIARRRSDFTMSQQTSRATQEKIDELVQRTREKEEERKNKRKEHQAGEASSSSQEHPSDPDKGQETTVAMSKAGCTVLIRCTGMGDKSARTRKTDDESGQVEEINVEEKEETAVEQESGSTVDDDDSGDEPSVVEFEDPIYELSQMYEMKPEYKDMTQEQEATEAQALTPTE